MEIDEDARSLAYRILIVIFIIITIVANAEYLFGYFRAPKAVYRAGHFGKVSLSLGSIFLAIFSYVVCAKMYFGRHTSDLTCTTILTALVYQYHYFTFVFGFTIVFTGLNIYHSQRQFWIFNPTWISLAMAAFPWLLSLLVMCPLALAGTEWDRCNQDYSLERRRAIVWVGILLPSIAALLFSVILNVNSSTSTQQPLTTTLNADPTSSILSPDPNLAMTHMDTTQNGSTHSPLGHPQSQQSAPHYSQQQYPQQNVHHTPPPNAQHYYPQHPPQGTTISAGDVIQTTAPSASAYITFQLIAMEKRGLLHASLIFFFSVLPVACLILGYHLNDDMNARSLIDPSTMVLISDICTWVFFLFPVLVPLVWRRQVQ